MRCYAVMYCPMILSILLSSNILIEIITLQRDSIALQMEWLYLLGKRKFHIMFTPVPGVTIRYGRTSLLEKWHDDVHYSRNMNQILFALNQCFLE